MTHLQPAGLPSGTIGRRSSSRSALLAPLWRVPAAQAVWALAALLIMVVVPWWAATQLGEAFGLSLHWAVAAEQARWLTAAFGLLPLLVAGVALAALPRWTQEKLSGPAAAPLTARSIATPLWMMLAAPAVSLAGLHLHSGLLALGLGLGAMGGAYLAGRGLVVLIESPKADHDHARAVLLGQGLLSVAQWVAAVALALRAPQVAQAAAQAALWAAALALVSIGLRKMPRFAADMLPAQAAWRPRTVLAALSLILTLEVLLAAAQTLGGGQLPAAAATLAAAIEAAAALMLFWLSLRWGLRMSLRRQAEAFDEAGEPVWARRGSQTLLAMGQVGYAGLGVSLGLQAVSHLLMSLSNSQLSLGQAPQLALGLLCLAPLTLALITRETLQRAQKPLCASPWAGLISLVLVVGGLMAVLAALFPSRAIPLNLFALQCTSMALLTWSVRQRRWGLWG